MKELNICIKNIVIRENRRLPFIKVFVKASLNREAGLLVSKSSSRWWKMQI